MLDTFEISGHWWLPELPEKKYCGRLSFSQVEGGNLDLLGLPGGFENINDPQNPEIILGLSTKGKPVTLYRCHLRHFNISIPGMQTSTYLIRFIFIGVHFNSDDDITFKGLSVNYTDLDEWVGISGFRVDNNAKDLNITYSYPDPITANINDNLQLGITYVRAGPWSALMTKEVTISQRTIIELKTYTNELNFFTFLEYLHHLSRLLILAVCRLVYPVQLLGKTIKNRQPMDHEVDFYPPVEIYYQLIENPDKQKPLLSNDMLFTFGDIQPRFQDFVQRWYSKAERLKTVHDLYFGSLYSQRLFINHRFLNIIQGLETYYRIQVNNRVLAKEEHKERVKEILDVVPEKYKNWVEGLLTPANQPSLKMMLWALITKYDQIITPLIGDGEKFISTIVATRNHLTHHSENQKAITDGTDLYNATRSLTILLESALLEELGFTIDEITQMQVDRQKFPM
ncbi:MAG: hypothetical protein A2W35_07115 [Chloroflexi bacterium RBG_16_57_11]|nr:MAG: hypothetical protein A2W35_07115 [Chloroflexi bacterium RBG_16_57_11]